MGDDPDVATDSTPLSTRLHGIRWRLERASEGTLRNLHEQLPKLLVYIERAVLDLIRAEREGDALCIEEFREQEIFEGFAAALQSWQTSPEQLRGKVVWALSAIISNTTQETSMDYLFSVLNPIFEHRPDLSDGDQQSYFVTILKHIALDMHKLPLLLVPRDQAVSAACARLPLFTCCVSLLDHSDPMVRTSAGNAILHVLKHAKDHAGVRAAIRDSVSDSLQSVLVRIKRSLRKVPCLQECTCRWMRGDAVTGRLAEWDPLRWSCELSPAELEEELRRNQYRYQSVIVAFHMVEQLQTHPHKRIVRAEARFPRVQDAVVALQDALRTDEGEFRGFVKEVRDLVASLAEAAAAEEEREAWRETSDGLALALPESADVDPPPR